MTESTDTAPRRGQSLRGRPVQEICTPVNEGNCPLRDEGEAVASGLRLTLWSYNRDRDPLESAACPLSKCMTTPSARAEEAAFFFMRAATPPSQEGNRTLPLSRVPNRQVRDSQVPR